MSSLPRSSDTTSLVGTTAAMRARDVSRPAEADLEAAERELIVTYRPPSTTAARTGGNTPDSS
jgi:hypothetical protein